MARTTEAEVRTILPSATQLTSVQIDAAIEAAMCSVDEIAAGCASSKSEDCLRNIERYLAAHYAAVTENTLSLKSEKDGCSEGSATYGFKFGDGVLGTPFGQMANTLSSGCLHELDKQPTGLFAIGLI